MPDLILIDGGKGQLSAARAALTDLGLTDQAVIALAKRLDEVFMPGLSDPHNIRRNSPALRLLQRIRDEAHRFALTYHRQVRSAATLRSVLQAIPGVGPQRRDLLIRTFGSLRKIRSASMAELDAVPGLSKALAREIHRFFHPDV